MSEINNESLPKREWADDPEETRQSVANISPSYLSALYIYIYIYNLHERGSSSNKETLYFRPDAFRLLPSSGVFALRLITYD